jgi:hypothetical protein
MEYLWNFDGIRSMPVTSPRNSAIKFSGTTRRPPFFDLCFKRQNPAVNACVAIFFSASPVVLFRLEWSFTEQFLAFVPCSNGIFFLF